MVCLWYILRSIYVYLCYLSIQIHTYHSYFRSNKFKLSFINDNDNMHFYFFFYPLKEDNTELLIISNIPITIKLDVVMIELLAKYLYKNL